MRVIELNGLPKVLGLDMKLDFQFSWVLHKGKEAKRIPENVGELNEGNLLFVISNFLFHYD